MKKWMIALLTVLALTVCAFPALAGGRVNPYRSQAEESLRQVKEVLAGDRTVTNDGLGVTISGPETFALGETPTYSAKVQNPESGVHYLYAFGFIDLSRDTGWVYFEREAREGSEFTFVQVFNAGDYIMWVRLYDANNPKSELASGWLYFTITGDTGAIDRKAEQVVAECRAEDEWHTALNLHDWLTTHIYYDHNLEYYGEDCILRGYGVCDSYSKAYRLLCQKAGFSIGRLINSNHAWNIIRIDGKWYQVDATWDDPGDERVPASGGEHHGYFCLTDFLMFMDHPGPYDYEPESFSSNACTSMDANYYIHEDLWRDLCQNYDWDYEAGSWCLVDRVDAIWNRLDQGEFSFSISLEDDNWDTYWFFDDAGELRGAYLGDKDYYIIACGMSVYPWLLSGDSLVRVSVTFDADERTLSFLLTSWGDVEETGTLRLGSKVRTVEQEAFMNTRATTVFLPYSVQSVGPYAFANSAVRVVIIANPDVEIDPTAFDGCERIMFRGSAVTEGSPAYAYAAEHGFLIVALD